MSRSAASSQDDVDAAAVLLDLPDSLWGELARGVRRATDVLAPSALPTELRPLRGWSPEGLLHPRAKPVVVRALVRDARLRDALLDALLGAEDRSRADAADVRILQTEHGTERTIAILSAQARWSELATAVAARVETLAAHGRAAAEAPAAPDPDRSEEMATLERRARSAAREQERLRRKVKELAAANESLTRRVAQLEDELSERTAAQAMVEQERQDERARARDRLARSRRRAERAEAEARGGQERLARAARHLERAARRLRDEVPASGATGGSQGHPGTASGSAVLREQARAEPGRPSVLPPGMDPDSAQAVVAWLRAPGQHVLVDGYNLTLSPVGRPSAGLEQQRAWLRGVCESAAARFRCRVTIVFDGDRGRGSAVAASRLVRIVFSAEGETADDRIVAVVDRLADDHPVLVVTADRELVDRCRALDADVTAPALFLAAVEGRRAAR